ncbi:hypothetical protein ACDQ55_07340 [Chitinophaga sp. 30R24]|uniref:hypothetical protein n=1 Tax=Chitinophaga sp. 30R24 TaxID=3248838 RepID=UPI003B8F54E3
MKPHYFIIGILWWGAVSCGHKAPRVITPAFYYWKQTWSGNPEEQSYLKNLPARRLYVKLFDVTTNEITQAPVPVAVFRQKAPLPEQVDIVPVVFLMNEVWAHADTTLAGKVSRLIQELCDSLPSSRIPEVQLDCDWTQTTRDAYFSFIRQIRQTPFFRRRRLSVTIRMYQVKYAVRTGIPPADRGLLMCYNMGDLRQAGAHNSILDLGTMEAYLGKNRVAGYPLPLDVALPLFEWSVLFHNNGTAYAGILRNIGTTELQDTGVFTPGKERLYTVRQDTSLNGYTLKKGNVIRRETIELSTLESSARLVAEQLSTKDPVVIFYHLDAMTLQKYPLNELQKIYHLFD